MANDVFPAYEEGDEYNYKKLVVDTAGNLKATGEFIFSGLNVELKITTMNVTDTATKLPATPLSGRNAISIKNKDEVENIYIGNSDVTADDSIGTTAGIKVEALGYINFDITDDIDLYARAESGNTVKVQIVEIS